MDTITETSKPNKWLEKLDALRSDYNYDLEEATEAFEFVQKVVELEADRITELEPYAKRTIGDLNKMACELSNFEYFTDGITLGEVE